MTILHAAALQFPITMNGADNLAALEALLAPLPRGTLAVAPEGALSGYLPEPHFVTRIDQAATLRALDTLAALAAARGLHIVAGACVAEDGLWRNASFYFAPNGPRARYDKINLAMSERETFAAGDALPVFDTVIDGAPVRLAIQMCREIRYPEQWRVLAAKGAQVFAYVNNAIGSKTGHGLWRAHLISRAAETQRFIIGANNAAPDQTCPSVILAPSGEALDELPIGATAAATAALDLTEVSDWVIDQARKDVVAVTEAHIKTAPDRSGAA